MCSCKVSSMGPLDTATMHSHRWWYHGQYGKGSSLTVHADGTWRCDTCASEARRERYSRHLDLVTDADGLRWEYVGGRT